MGVVFLDTETTGLTPGWDEVFEIALITEAGEEHEFRVRPRPGALAHMTPQALAVNRFSERTAAPDWHWESPEDVMDRLSPLLEGQHIVGAVPDFDARFLTEFYKDYGRKPPVWHYHLIDVETLAVGWLAGYSDTHRACCPELTPPDTLPWDSELLSSQLDVKPPADHERHTALGDARWAKALYERVMNA